jgi:hypothetical protein
MIPLHSRHPRLPTTTNRRPKDLRPNSHRCRLRSGRGAGTEHLAGGRPRRLAGAGDDSCWRIVGIGLPVSSTEPRKSQPEPSGPDDRLPRPDGRRGRHERRRRRPWGRPRLHVPRRHEARLHDDPGRRPEVTTCVIAQCRNQDSFSHGWSAHEKHKVFRIWRRRPRYQNIRDIHARFYPGIDFDAVPISPPNGR